MVNKKSYHFEPPLAITASVDFEHSNPKLFCVVCAHNLLQHVNDLPQWWLCGTFCVSASVRLC
jgi:hypothetical protein